MVMYDPLQDLNGGRSMVVVRKVIIIVMIGCMVHLSWSLQANAAPGETQADSLITANQPEMMTTPEERIPVDEVKESGYSKWVWIGLGVVVVGAAAALAGGGGGGGGGDDGGTPAATDEGNVEVTW